MEEKDAWLVENLDLSRTHSMVCRCVADRTAGLAEAEEVLGVLMQISAVAKGEVSPVPLGQIEAEVHDVNEAQNVAVAGSVVVRLVAGTVDIEVRFVPVAEQKMRERRLL